MTHEPAPPHAPTPEPALAPEAGLSLTTEHVFVTGGTGFVGQAIIERLLISHPGTRITVLVRGKGSNGPRRSASPGSSASPSSRGGASSSATRPRVPSSRAA